jgi:hypothetical protein
MLYTVAMGGITSLPLVLTMTTLFKSIFGINGDTQSEEEMGKWEIALKKGLPAAFLGIDLSGRVGIDMFSVSSIMDDPNSMKNYIGGALSIFLPAWGDPRTQGRIPQALELARQGRYTEAFAKGLPDMIGNPLLAYKGVTQGVSSFSGTPLTDANGDIFKYNTWQAIIKGMGFSPTEESLLYSAQNKKWDVANQSSAEQTRLHSEIKGLLNVGNIADARQVQGEAQAAGIIADKTDYVKQFIAPQFMKDAYDQYKAGGKPLSTIEKELIHNIYGTSVKVSEINTIRKEFAIMRIFGPDNKNAQKVENATTLKLQADALQTVKASMTPEEFKTFYANGRKTIKLESGNDSYILISNQLDAEFKKAPNRTADLSPQYRSGQKTSESNILDTIYTYAKALGTDPVTAFNRIFTGQHIRRIDNGAIIVERMTLASSEAERSAQAVGGSTAGMRLDHTIPLELGGSNAKSNLKLITESEWASYTPIENFIAKEMRAGRMTKTQAQSWITKFKNKEVTSNDVYNYQSK